MNAAAHSLEMSVNDESVRIQTLRGLACLLLVSFHVIGTDFHHGIAVPDDSVYRVLTNIFMHLRMPLFCFLSGFVYAYKPIQPGMGGVFARKKLRRLIIPLLVVGSAFFVLQQLTPSNTHTAWNQMWRVYVFPYGHFWFLQAIIVLFAGLAVLEHYRVLKTFRGFLVVFAAVLAAHFWLDAPQVLSLERAVYLVPFFLLGVGAHRWRDVFNHPRLKVAVSAAFVTCMAYHVWACSHGHVAARGSYFGTALSLASILAAMYWTPPMRWLAWIGGYSFTLYLYHVFFSAAARIVLNKMHITNVDVHFILGCLAAIAGPILFELIVKRYDIARILLLGQPTEKRRVENCAPVPQPVLQPQLRG